MRRTLVGTLAVVAVVALSSSSFAQSADPWVATWRLNVAKSKYSPGPAPRSQTVVNESAPNGIRSITDTVDAQGMKIHQVVDAPFDGKEHEVKGSLQPTTRIYKRIDARTYEFVNRVNGKVTTTTRVAISADGKTRTNTTTGTDDQGRKVNNVAVYERQ